MTALYVNRTERILYDEDQRVFDAHARAWRRVPESAVGGAEIGLLDAVRWLQRESGDPARAPVSVIGDRDAAPNQLATAEALGAALASLGLTVLCGGLEGVMTAVAKGASEAGGQVVGVLPDADWRAANSYVTTVIASGVGLARNAIIAEAGLCLVAIGGKYGTLSEMAYGKQFGRPVFALEDAPDVADVTRLETVDQAVEAVARVALNLDGTETAWR